MYPRSKAVALVIAIPLLLLSLVACNQADQKPQWQSPPSLREGFPTDPVQKVNGTIITRAELDQIGRAHV